jgi:hypothetical protein
VVAVLDDASNAALLSKRADDVAKVARRGEAIIARVLAQLPVEVAEVLAAALVAAFVGECSARDERAKDRPKKKKPFHTCSPRMSYRSGDAGLRLEGTLVIRASDNIR